MSMINEEGNLMIKAGAIIGFQLLFNAVAYWKYHVLWGLFLIPEISTFTGKYEKY